MFFFIFIGITQAEFVAGFLIFLQYYFIIIFNTSIAPSALSYLIRNVYLYIIQCKHNPLPFYGSINHFIVTARILEMQALHLGLCLLNKLRCFSTLVQWTCRGPPVELRSSPLCVGSE